MLLAVQAAVAQAGGEQADGMDGLAQVMAGLGEKLRLGAVGRLFGFGGQARALEQGVHVGRHHQGGEQQGDDQVGLRLPVGRHAGDDQQRQGGQHGRQQQVAGAVAQAIAHRDPDEDGVDRQHRFAADGYGQGDAGVVAEHGQHAAHRVVAGASANVVPQGQGGSQEQGFEQQDPAGQRGVDGRAQVHHQGIADGDRGDDQAYHCLGAFDIVLRRGCGQHDGSLGADADIHPP
ncbi:hypothetical protein SRABI70_03567 [Pseudomonas sp. Bi70]|nr:hypothetical protein SRABI70_03567 [Pseudomonas sp. Bi70]